MQGLTVTGMEIVSVWGVTTIAALVFPYVKRAKGIWESSPYRTWKFLGVPLVSWGGLVSLVYLGILFYFLIFTEEMKDSNGQSWILYGIVWVIGILWYFFWAWRSKTRRRGRRHDLRGAAAGVILRGSSRRPCRRRDADRGGAPSGAPPRAFSVSGSPACAAEPSPATRSRSSRHFG